MPLDPEVAALLERQKNQPSRASLTVAETREMMRRAGALAGPPPELPRLEDLVLPGNVPARQYWSADDERLPIVLYFHGGRFFSGDLESHDALCRVMALRAGCRVVAIDYRLAPEHPCPAAVEDACRAIEWVAGQGVPAAIAGDSAGANLAAVAASTGRGRELRCQVLVYPMIDPACGSRSYAEYAEGYGPGTADMRRGWSLYLQEGAEYRGPDASPGLPPAFVLTAEYDTLRDEGEAYARRLMEAGNLVQARRYLGAIHGFFAMPGILAVARTAMEDVAGYLRLHLAA